MFDPAPYHYSVPFIGNSTDAFNVARTALLSLGFEILVDTATELHGEGPGMHSNRQPELLGATLIKFNVADSKISVTATLGGVATMKTFVYLFPPGLVLSLLLLNTMLSGDLSGWIYLIVFPWFLIAPWIGRKLESSTTRAIDRLVRGMAQAKTR